MEPKASSTGLASTCLSIGFTSTGDRSPLGEEATLGLQFNNSILYVIHLIYILIFNFDTYDNYTVSLLYYCYINVTTLISRNKGNDLLVFLFLRRSILRRAINVCSALRTPFS